MVQRKFQKVARDYVKEMNRDDEMGEGGRRDFSGINPRSSTKGQVCQFKMVEGSVSICTFQNGSW